MFTIRCNKRTEKVAVGAFVVFVHSRACRFALGTFVTKANLQLANLPSVILLVNFIVYILAE